MENLKKSLPETMMIEEFAAVAKEIYGNNIKVSVTSSDYPKEQYMMIDTGQIFAHGKPLLSKLSEYYGHKLLGLTLVDYDRGKETNLLRLTWKKGTCRDCKRVQIGSSIYGELILANRMDNRLVLKALELGENNEFFAYYVNDPAYEIPDEFELLHEFSGSLRIYDDTSVAAFFSGDSIRIFKHDDEYAICAPYARFYQRKEP